MMTFMFLMTNERRSVPDAYTLTDAVRTQFIEEDFGDANEKTFMDIATYEEMYMWARDVFTDGLLPAEYYDGTEIPPDKKRVTYYNRVVGGVRMRQLRVTPNAGCTIKGNVTTSFIPTQVRTWAKSACKYVEKYTVITSRDLVTRAKAEHGRDVHSQNGTIVHQPDWAAALPTPPTRTTQMSDRNGDLRYDKYEICLGLSKYR